MKSPPLTDAQRLTWGYCGQRKSTVKHTNTKRRHTVLAKEWTDRQTDGIIAAVLTNCWLQAGSSREPMKGVAFVFGTCLSGPEEHSKKEGEGQKYLVLPPLCTER